MRAGAETERLLARCAPAVADVARAVREAVLAALPGCQEQADEAANVVGYGYGGGYKGLICTLILSKKEVKLGFYRGAELPDPNGLLEGKGKVHRYVVANRLAADDPRMVALLQSAAAAWRSRAG